MTTANLDALDRLNELAACYRAVETLTIPETDASLINREDLAVLLGLLNRLSGQALSALTETTINGNLSDCFN